MVAEWSETNDRPRVQQPEAVHTDIDRLAAEPPARSATANLSTFMFYFKFVTCQMILIIIDNGQTSINISVMINYSINKFPSVDLMTANFIYWRRVIMCIVINSKRVRTWTDFCLFNKTLCEENCNPCKSITNII